MVPEYARPELVTTPDWNDIPGYETPAGKQAAAQLEWQEFFKQPELQQIIGMALENNRDLRLAALNIAEARSIYRIARSGLIPNINAHLDKSYQGSSDESNASGEADSDGLYTANLGASSYELDLFGRVRSRNLAALNEYLATTAAQEVVRNALIAETANAYLQLLADQKLLDLTEMTLKAQERTHDILSQSRERGMATEQDVARAETAVETARVNWHRYRRFVEQDKNALILLLGVPHEEGLIPITSLDKIGLPENLPVGLPSEVLLGRPDIRQAELELLARNADIGAARAAFFPSITLTGAYGFASPDLSTLFTQGGVGSWSFVPRMTIPLFQRVPLQANLNLTETRKEQAVVRYEQAIQAAFREVSDALAARATLEEELNSQKRLVAAAQRVFDSSEARYKSGLDSFLSVLDAQRALYTYQQNEIEIQRQRLSNLVNLYKVLGGGSVSASPQEHHEETESP